MLDDGIGQWRGHRVTWEWNPYGERGVEIISCGHRWLVSCLEVLQCILTSRSVGDVRLGKLTLE